MNQYHEIPPLQQWLGWMTEQAMAAMPHQNRAENFFDSLKSALLDEAGDEKIREKEKITTLIAKVKQIPDDGNNAGVFIEKLWAALHRKTEQHSQTIAARLIHKENSETPPNAFFQHSLKENAVITIHYTFVSKETGGNGQNSPTEKEKAFVTRMLEYLSAQTDNKVIFRYVVTPDSKQPVLLIGQPADARQSPLTGTDSSLHSSQFVRQAAFEIGRFLGLSSLFHQGDSAADSMMAERSMPATETETGRLFDEKQTGRLHPADIVRHADILAINAMIKGIQQQIDQELIEEFNQFLQAEEFDFSTYSDSDAPDTDNVSSDPMDQLINFLVGTLPDKLPAPWASVLARINFNNAANEIVVATDFYKTASQYHSQADGTEKVYTVSFPAITDEKKSELSPTELTGEEIFPVRKAVEEGLFIPGTVPQEIQKTILAILNGVESVIPARFRLARSDEKSHLTFRMYQIDGNTIANMPMGFAINHNAQHATSSDIWLDTTANSPDRVRTMVHEILHALGLGHYKNGHFVAAMAPAEEGTEITGIIEIQPVEQLSLQKIHGKRIPDSLGDQHDSLHAIKTDGHHLASSYRIMDFGGHSDTLRFVSSAASDTPVSHTSLKIKQHSQNIEVTFRNGTSQVPHAITITLKPHSEIEYIEFQYTQKTDRMYRLILEKQAAVLQWENWRWDGSMWQQDNTAHPVEVHVETSSTEAADVISDTSNRKLSNVMTEAEDADSVTKSVRLLADWMASADYVPQTIVPVITETVSPIEPVLYVDNPAFANNLVA